MKEIKLTQDKVALVDDEDFERINQYKWCAGWSVSTQSFYAVRTIQGEININTGRRIQQTINMASVILRTTEIADHKNHVTLDNRKQNLRICTKSQNQHNRRPQKNCTSRYKGVCWNKARNRWRTQIKLKDIFNQPFDQYLGLFKDEVEAAKAYDRAAKKGFGEFACLNFPGIL